ncbi:stage V sporulation protein D [Ammonifex degensii KC4]|uniref:Stage V sporulation protein D n=1 Tax=Ammonifex degensii (strain DSM 10501 / KC4) TaxID=429009 RepID=C9R8N6_AMMDK|nr:stage V sporulation protein D [Ammonifex degensii]ACX52665.1 stage V sporulation protein D [Ammonifex degensii KC4]
MANIVIRRRLALLFLSSLLFFTCLAGRLFWLQIVKGAELQKQAQENRMRDIPVEAKRGDITDRNGRLLVTSVSAESVAAFPPQIKDPGKVAAELAPLLEMPEEKLKEILSRRQAFVWLKRKVDYHTAQKIRKLRLEGIELYEESRRQYICGSLAAHILGFVGVDNQGLLGVEKEYDQALRGVPGRIVIEQDAVGRDIPSALHRFYPPRPGDKLVLTIDETIQHFVERELDKVVAQYHPASAVIIVMDPKTGEILALGNRPTFDPENWQKAPAEVWNRNLAIWQIYEPGSTFKIVTAAAALAEGVVRPEDHFYCPGYIKVADRIIRCWKDGGHGSETFAEVVQNSCNVGFIQVGLKLGKEKLYHYIRAFGFGKLTGIDLPGEASGLLIPEDKVTNLNLATISIGQSVGVTPIQLITAAAAVANGGYLVRPHVVKAIVSPEGKVVKEFSSQPVRRVIPAQVARELCRLLENVVLKGTGVKAYLDGYRAAGKTGTAQVVSPKGGYVPGKYVASFVGFAPVEDPRLVTLVVISEPQGAYYGGEVAAPVFKAVMQDALRYLGVPPQEGLARPAKPWYEQVPESKPVKVPSVVNLPVHEAVKTLKAAGLNFVLEGEGDVVCSQVPQGGATVDAGTQVVLNLKATPEGGGAEVTVPDLSGLGVREAAVLLEKLGLVLSPEGTGVAVSQSPAPGKRVKRGTAIKVKFVPPELKTPP